MDVPQKIKNRIYEIILQNEAHENNIRKAEEAHRARLKKIDDLREARLGLLTDTAEFVGNWVCELEQNEELKKVGKLRSKITLFVAHFWLGEPASTTQITTCAKLSLNMKESVLVYDELHKGRVSSQIVLPYHSGFSCLVQLLHPEFLLQFAESIRNGKVWDYIEQSLKIVMILGV